MFCDLHIHSTASDGTDPPEAIPALAKRSGLHAIALTDHDTTEGLETCAAAARKVQIKFVPGIELSANANLDWPIRPNELQKSDGLHLLGYFIKPSKRMKLIQQQLFNSRGQRNRIVIAKLNDLGVRIDYDEVLAAAGEERPAIPNDLAPSEERIGQSTTVIGRPHIATVLVRKGYVKSIHEAFTRYLGGRGAAYVPKDRLSATEALDAIHDSGGLAILAHPVQLRFNRLKDLEHLVARLKHLGLDGIESRHSDHGPKDVERFEKLASRFGLLTTGGSDYHGLNKTAQLGRPRVPFRTYETLFNTRNTTKPPRRQVTKRN